MRRTRIGRLGPSGDFGADSEALIEEALVRVGQGGFLFCHDCGRTDLAVASVQN